MATGRPRGRVKPRIDLLSPDSPRSGVRSLVASTVFALSSGVATANKCGVEFLYPTPGLSFYYLDTINVTYVSNLSDPTLFCWCGQGQPAKSQSLHMPSRILVEN
jgi:hypothetical protein